LNLFLSKLILPRFFGTNLALLKMSDPQTYQFDLPSTGRPSDVIINESWYPGVQDYWANSTSSRIYDAILGIKAVVIHATAGSTSSGAISVMRAGVASFHWLVPDENEPQHGNLVWACAPEARAAWHVRNSCSHPEVNAGTHRTNHWSLGIEIVNQLTKVDGYSDWQIRATAQIVRHCWAKYPNLKHIVSHAKIDPDRRSDPGDHFPWSKFKSYVYDISYDGVPSSALLAIPARMLPEHTPIDGCCKG
jgi:N-acetyl-anhydromuramyl-L-alanine amidase AmpD